MALRVWKEGKFAERMRVEFFGNDNKTEWVDENDLLIRGRLGCFDLSRSAEQKF